MRVILRTAFDVPLTEHGGVWRVADDSRIRASLSTIRTLLKQRAQIVIISWLGRPKGVDPAFSLRPVAQALEALLAHPVQFVPAVTGPAVRHTLDAMRPGDIVMLENVRFDSRDTTGDDSLADELATYGERMIFDAFAQAHRTCPSVTGLLERLPSSMGDSMRAELDGLQSLITAPKKPFVVVLGGAKISDKIDLISSFMKKADAILIGGAMAHIFLKLRGVKLSDSLVEGRSGITPTDEHRTILERAAEILAATEKISTPLTKKLGIPFISLPTDLIAAPPPNHGAGYQVIDFSRGEHIPWHWGFYDLGPKTLTEYSTILMHARTVFWNGPLGYTEDERYRTGTAKIAQTLARQAKSGTRSITGGGDTLAALDSLGLAKKMSFSSTGGGAALEYIAHGALPALKYLKS